MDELKAAFRLKIYWKIALLQLAVFFKIYFRIFDGLGDGFISVERFRVSIS